MTVQRRPAASTPATPHEQQSPEQRLQEWRRWLQELDGLGNKTLEGINRHLDGPVMAYPAGDQERYKNPLRRDGQVVPSREGQIHAVDREHNTLSIKHADGTISTYRGVQNISADLQVGQNVSRETALGQADTSQFFYQRHKETAGGGKVYVAPGVAHDLMVADRDGQLANHRPQPGHQAAPTVRSPDGQRADHGGEVNPQQFAENTARLAEQMPTRPTPEPEAGELRPAGPVPERGGPGGFVR